MGFLRKSDKMKRKRSSLKVREILTIPGFGSWRNSWLCIEAKRGWSSLSGTQSHVIFARTHTHTHTHTTPNERWEADARSASRHATRPPTKAPKWMEEWNLNENMNEWSLNLKRKNEMWMRRWMNEWSFSLILAIWDGIKFQWWVIETGIVEFFQILCMVLVHGPFQRQYQK